MRGSTIMWFARDINRIRRVFAGAGIALLTVMFGVHLAYAGKWLPLNKDGLHDRRSPGLELLQSPEAALGSLPTDTAGNKVDWSRAMDERLIKPRAALAGDKTVQVLDLNIIMSDTAGHPNVLFPHKVHTQWLDCANCHESLFKSKTGATPVSMGSILRGEHCGVCHGAVAFPLTECRRCHTLPHDS